jgi:DNA helicase-2/ATP-dependent DNA helicase PcrA
MAIQQQESRHYNESFQKILEQLNPEQASAVNHIEGPVMVVAGPGTGKTHILSARIGKILLETDVQAKNILCLTFTDAGVNAMRNRLLQFIGPEAHRIHIYTFHSFCNTIIQDNLERFGRQDMEPLSELERVEIIRQLLDELPPAHELRLGRNDPYFYERHLQNLFQHMKSEGWTPRQIEERIDEYLESLPEREEFVYKVNRGDIRKGDLKTAKIEATVEKMERLRAAIHLFPVYQRAMARARRYDFEDMILWVSQAFRENESLLRSYQEQYLYLLIDEYQDTNGAQNEIIRQLVAYWDQPNLFIVGDDDQSIYEFQGARLKNLLDFYEDYSPGLKLIVLTSNYRSSQLILDAAHVLIQHNSIRIFESLQSSGMEKILIASNDSFARLKDGIHIARYPGRLQEEVALANHLEDLYKEGFPLEEVAVIYAQHRQVESLVELLEKKQVPYNLKRKINILNLPLIRNFRQMLEYFQAELRQPHSGEHLLYQMLHFSFFNVDPDDIATLSLHQARQGWEQRKPWRVLLAAAVEGTSFGLKAPQSIKALVDFEKRMLRELSSIGLPAFAERLLNRSGLLSYLLSQEDSAWWIQVFRAFIDFIRKEANRNPRLTLAQLLQTLDRMDSNRLPIALNRAVFAEKGINLLTAHSAKGLEFERVYLIDCTKKFWEPRNRNASYQFALPDTLTYSGEEDALEARRRLMYVAMTRAKAYLQLSFSETDSTGKPLQPAIFINELLTNPQLSIENRALDSQQLLEAEALKLEEATVPFITIQNKAMVAALLEGFQLSVSAMNRYQQCPLAFYYERVLRAPVLIRPAAHYGTAMHHAMQRLFEKMKSAKSQAFPPSEQLLLYFEQEMQGRRGFLPAEEYDRLLERGKLHLKGYYQYYLGTWEKNVLLEYTPRNVEVEGAPITGSIDKLEQTGILNARVVDYKTGSQSKSKLSGPTNANPHGGSYWRQLVFYKLLYENYPGNTRVVDKGAISYLEPDTGGEFVERELSISQSDARKVRAMIKEVYGKIMAHEFYTGCGEPNCSWCQLIKQNLSADTFSDPEIEELDD